MKIIFRCSNCETINTLSSEYMYRFCKNCGKITTYTIGEAVICEKHISSCDKFLNANKLQLSIAEEFFNLAEQDETEISKIIIGHQKKKSEILDLPSASLHDTILLILKESKTEILDDIIRYCSYFNISKLQLEKILLQLKKEGIIFQPKSWLIKLA